MSELTLDEAVKHCLEEAEQEERNSKTGKWFEGEDWNIKAREQCAECAADYRQLAEWLTELMKKSEQIAEYKRLLKAAVEDIQDMLYQVDSVTVCTHCIHATAICYGGSDCEHEAKWTHLDEALKLIGGGGDTNG